MIRVYQKAPFCSFFFGSSPRSTTSYHRNIVSSVLWTFPIPPPPPPSPLPPPPLLPYYAHLSFFVIMHLQSHNHDLLFRLRGGATFPSPSRLADDLLDAGSSLRLELLEEFPLLISSLKSFDLPKTAKVFQNQFQSFAWPLQLCLLVNVAIFVAWHVLPANFMTDHFTERKKNLREGRLHTLITFAFSHMSAYHLFFNMVCLTSFGPALLTKLRPKVVMGMILSASLVSGLTTALLRPVQLLFWPQQRRKIVQESQLTVGFSGVNTALLYFYALLNPQSLLSVANFPPMPAVDAIQCLIGLDLLGLGLNVSFFSTGIAHATHIGGYLAAFLIHVLLCQTKLGRNLLTTQEYRALTRRSPNIFL